ncbi:MAG: DUF4276 family protein [Dehalococcoidia bacterium]|nr:DUF4276 family protein [Dehalococcoidia bacterium]
MTLVLRGCGNLLDASKVARHVKPLLATRRGLEKVIVVVDAYCNGEETEAKASACEDDITDEHLGIPVHWFVVQYELDSWLAQLPETIKAAYGLTLRAPNASQSRSAKAFLKRHLPKYQPMRDNLKLARSLNLDTLAQRNPNFREFKNHLTAI